MLYRQRTLDEWNALGFEEQIGIERGGPTGFGYVVDEQATRDAAMGAEVRVALLDEAPDKPVSAAELREYVLYSMDVADGWGRRILLAIVAALELLERDALRAEVARLLTDARSRLPHFAEHEHLCAEIAKALEVEK